MYVLDSNAFIEAVNDTPNGKKVLSFIGDVPASTTSVSVQEVLLGADEPNKEKYDKLLEGCHVLPHDADAARTGARLQRELKGNRLSTTDAMIAGICISKQATLVTFDKAFKRVKGLNVVEL